MRVIFRDKLIVLAAEGEADAEALRRHAAGLDDHAFHLVVNGPRGVSLHDLGPRAEACREPINIHAGMHDERLKLIGNLAHAPFELHGQGYASVESFWQGLKFPDEPDRRRISHLHGAEAKQAGETAPPLESLAYRGETIRVGRPEHWRLMRHACMAKFTQNEAARSALLSTGARPLTHRVRRDSLTIPGVVMADIWMRIRTILQGKAAPADAAEDAPLASEPEAEAELDQ